MSAHIVPFETRYLTEVKEIFFESSTRKTFKDEAEKEAFFYKYVGLYLTRWPDLAFVAIDKKVLGYVIAAPVSEGTELNNIQPHLLSFKNEFGAYPAHLHINCHQESRGQGIGGKLVTFIVDALRAKNIAGLHIMTGVHAQNRGFYRKLGFDHEVIENFHGSPILFMGKKL